MNEVAKLIDRVRNSNDLISRLEECRFRIAYLTSNRLPPRLTIPPSWDDDDIYIDATLEDAIVKLKEGTGEG